MSRFASVAGEQVTDLIGRIAEPGRFTRGRALFRKGSVSDLVVVDRSIAASVRGSRGDRYDTSIATTPAPPGVARQIAQAIAQAQGRDEAGHPGIEELLAEGVGVCPGEVDLGFNCDCADWDEPCKHVVAVLLAFADRVDLDLTELLRWRGVDLLAPEPTEPEPTEPDSRSAKLSELEALLGHTALRVPKGRAGVREPKPPTADPALAEFLGVGRTIDPVDVSDLAAPAPLFADVQLGPLADLGPELAMALAIIADGLDVFGNGGNRG